MAKQTVSVDICGPISFLASKMGWKIVYLLSISSGGINDFAPLKLVYFESVFTNCRHGCMAHTFSMLFGVYAGIIFRFVEVLTQGMLDAFGCPC